MGRRKIPIEVITNEKSRLVTFAKRKNGLFKKAYELSILCGCEVAVLVFTPSNRLYQYSTDNMDHAIRRRAQHSKANSFLTNKDMKKMAKSSTNDIAETNFESNSDEDGVTGLTLDDEPFDTYEQGECIMMNTSDSVLSASFGAKQTVSQNSINFTAQYDSSDRMKRKRSNKKKCQISSTRNGITVKNGVYSDDCANVQPMTVTSVSTISDNLCTYSSFADPYVLQCSSATSSNMTLAPCQLLYYTDSVDQSKSLIPIAVPCVPSQLASTVVVPSVNVVGPTSSYASQDKDSNSRVTDGKFSSVTQPPINRPLYTSAVDNHDNEQNQSSTPMDLTNHYQNASKKPNTSRGVSTSVELSVLATRNSVQTIARTLSNSTTSMYTPSRWRSRFPDNLKLEIQPYALNNIEPTGLTADIRSVDFLPTPEITRYICGIEAKDNDGTNSRVQTPTTNAKEKNLEKLP